LTGLAYLDHAGTTLYAQSLIDACAGDLKKSLYGNPHSGVDSSQRSSQRVEAVRLKLLKYCNASPKHFDVVFVANATAAVKLVAEAFRDLPAGFDYAYHQDCHNSLVGIRQLARDSRCITSEHDLSEWLKDKKMPAWRRRWRLFAFPGQSNLTGRRLPLDMCRQVSQARTPTNEIYSLLDAAALVSTSALDLSHAKAAPDFTAVSLYKIFGYPDLGALIVKKSSSNILLQKKYFGGGTVDMVTTDRPWHQKKDSVHEALEEGTLPFHNIVALGHALDVHAKLYGTPSNVSRHARYVAQVAQDGLLELSHGNGRPVCHMYGREDAERGPVVAFNLLDTAGTHHRTYVVEHLAIKAKIALRVGGMCNPGGIQRELSIPYNKMWHNYDAGIRCGDDRDLPDDFRGAVGMVRVSFGAMSSLGDVERLLQFVTGSFVDRAVSDPFFSEASEAPAPSTKSDSPDNSLRHTRKVTLDSGSTTGEKAQDKGVRSIKTYVKLSKWWCF
jgi:molybdenum cofactor sulfurtransferase